MHCAHMPPTPHLSLWTCEFLPSSMPTPSIHVLPFPTLLSTGPTPCFPYTTYLHTTYRLLGNAMSPFWTRHGHNGYHFLTFRIQHLFLAQIPPSASLLHHLRNPCSQNSRHEGMGRTHQDLSRNLVVPWLLFILEVVSRIEARRCSS